MSKRLSYILIGATSASLIIGVCTFVFWKSQHKTTVATTSVVQPVDVNSNYAKAIRSSLMDKCDPDGKRTAYCACMWDTIVYHHGGVEATERYDLRKENIANLPPEIVSDTENCLAIQQKLDTGKI